MFEQSFVPYVPKALSKVEANYSGLNDLINNLSAKVSTVSGSIEKEFLSAYRIHMLEIQSELKQLKQAIKNAEEEIKNDGNVSKLENEVQWFSNETTRLKTHSNNMQKDIDHIKMRSKALLQQNEFLSDQLKAVMKRRQILEAEIASLLQHEGGSHPESSVRSSMGGTTKSKEQLERARYVEEMKIRRMSKSKSAPIIQYKKSPLKKKRSGNELLQLLQVTKTEEELERCVHAVWMMISERRVEVLQAMSQKKGVEIDKGRLGGIPPHSITGLVLDNFTEMDKLAVLVRLVQHPEIFATLTEVLIENYGGERFHGPSE